MREVYNKVLGLSIQYSKRAGEIIAVEVISLNLITESIYVCYRSAFLCIMKATYLVVCSCSQGLPNIELYGMLGAYH
jgi:hypothetical protein